MITIEDLFKPSDIRSVLNTNGVISHTLGNAKSGEVYNEKAIVFRMPGLISTPMSVGSFDANGVFTASNYSQSCSQALGIRRGTNWYSIGFRDTRNQALLPQDNQGETRIIAEANPMGASIYLPLSGDLTLSAGSSSSSTLSMTFPTINMNGNTHPVGLGDKILAELVKIQNALNSLVVSGATTSTPPIPISGKATATAVYVAPTAASFISSTTVNIGQ
jgi:hypothetical protein